MTGAEIRKERKRLESELSKLETQQKIVMVQLEGLESQCEHPKSFKTSHMGESCRDCPDCGACDIGQRKHP